MKLMLFYAALSIVFAIPINIVTSKSGEEWFEKMTLNNKELNTLSAWVHALLVIIFTIASIYTFYSIKEEARIIYAKMQLERSKTKDSEWLKTRTVHIRGIPPHDRKGYSIVKKLNRQLKFIGGKVLAIINIPDFEQFFELELQKLQYDDLIKKPYKREPFFKRLCVSKRYRTTEYYERMKDGIEDKIEQVLLKPVLSSGHAFVCFDTIKSANYCLEKFRLSMFDNVKLSLTTMKDSCLSLSCFNDTDHK